MTAINYNIIIRVLKPYLRFIRPIIYIFAGSKYFHRITYYLIYVLMLTSIALIQLNDMWNI